MVITKNPVTLGRRYDSKNELALVARRLSVVSKKWHSVPQYLEILKAIDATPGAAVRSDSLDPSLVIHHS